jgi:glutaredoxin
MIQIYFLESCYYSKKAEELLNKYNFPYNKIMVKQSEKENIKKQLNKNTFPQIYYYSNDKCYHIGGYSDLENLIINKNITDIDKLAKLYN